VERDRRLALLHRGRCRLYRNEVAALLQLGEVVDAGLNVVERPAVGEGGRVDAGEGRTGLGRVAVERDLALVLRLREVRDGGRADGHALGVAADRDEAAVVVVPGRVRRLLIR